MEPITKLVLHCQKSCECNKVARVYDDTYQTLTTLAK